jgi:hypothetical protein
MSVSSYIFNSTFRNSGTISAPTFIIEPALQDISSYKIKSAKIPLSVPIIDGRNNKLYIQETGGSILTATIASGNYNANTITSAVQTAINAVMSTQANVSYSAVDNKIIISNGTGPSFKFVENSLPLYGASSRHAYYELGLLDDVDVWGTSHTTANIDLSGVNELHIVSNFGNSSVVNRNLNLLGTINVEEENLSVSTHEDHSNDFIESNTNTLSYLSMSFVDGRYRPITLDKDFSINLLIKSD